MTKLFSKTQAALALVIACAALCWQVPVMSASEGSGTNQAPAAKPKIGLIMPVKTDMTVHTDHASIACGKGTLVFFLDRGRDAAFFNLNSKHKGDVKLTIGNEIVKPIPGEEVVITADMTSDFPDVNPGKLISFRNPKVTHQGSNLRVFTADFSIASAVMGIKQLQAMLHSDDAYQRHLINEVLKNHAIWSETANTDGPYSGAK